MPCVPRPSWYTNASTLVARSRRRYRRLSFLPSVSPTKRSVILALRVSAARAQRRIAAGFGRSSPATTYCTLSASRAPRRFFMSKGGGLAPALTAGFGRVDALAARVRLVGVDDLLHQRVA